MKLFKMFGLVALAALMAVALVNTGSAMATTLCEEDEAECATPNEHWHLTSVGKTKLLTSLITIECDELFLGTILLPGPETEIYHGTITKTNCGSCSVTEENGPAEIKVLTTGHETAKVTGEWLMHVNCSSINCRYNGVGLTGTAKGPLLSTQTNGEVSIQEQTINKESGIFCPSTAKLDSVISSLSATYITS